MSAESRHMNRSASAMTFGTIIVVATFPDPSRPNTLKGGYRRVTQLLRLLQDWRKVLLISTSRPFKCDGVPAEVVVCSSRLWWIRAVRVFAALIKLLRRDRTAIVLAYNPTIHMLPVFLACKLFAARCVLDYVDFQGAIPGQRLWARWISQWVERFLISRCGYFLTSSYALAERIRQLNPLAKTFYYPGTCVLPRRVWEVPLSPDRPVRIVYAGAMLRTSGLYQLIDAFLDIGTVRAELLLLGGGPEQGNIAKYIAHRRVNSIVIAEVSDDELFRLLTTADILVLPYLRSTRNHYNFPSKLVEYLWAGKAILATAVGEVPRWIKHQETGYLVHCEDSEVTLRLRQGLATLIENPQLRVKLGEGARKLFEDRCAPDKVGGTLRTFLMYGSDGSSGWPRF